MLFLPFTPEFFRLISLKWNAYLCAVFSNFGLIVSSLYSLAVWICLLLSKCILEGEILTKLLERKILQSDLIKTGSRRFLFFILTVDCLQGKKHSKEVN